MRSPAPIITCACCDLDGRHNGRGLCDACWSRHNDAGTLHYFPLTKSWTARRARLEDYRDLIKTGVRDPDMIARRLGCTIRTVQRYAAEYLASQPENRKAA